MQRHVATHKPRQIACAGFVWRGRGLLTRFFVSLDIGRHRARQVFSLLIASTISLTAKVNPGKTRRARIGSPQAAQKVRMFLIHSLSKEILTKP